MADPKLLTSNLATLLSGAKNLQIPNPRAVKISPSVMEGEKKHWEDTWNRAEEMIQSLPESSVEEHVAQIQKYAKLIGEGNHLLLGEVVFEICGLTKQLNINIDALLNRICDHYEKELAFHDPNNVSHYGGEKRFPNK